MSAGLYNISAEQGATYSEAFAYTDDADVAIDMTSGSLRMQIRDDAGVLILSYPTEIVLTITDAVNGLFNINILASVMEGVVAGDYNYDVEYVNGVVVERMMEGKFCVKADITKAL